MSDIMFFCVILFLSVSLVVCFLKIVSFFTPNEVIRRLRQENRMLIEENIKSYELHKSQIDNIKASILSLNSACEAIRVKYLREKSLREKYIIDNASQYKSNGEL